MSTITPDQIKRKIAIADKLIAMLADDPDPRAPAVAEKLADQRAQLVAMLDHAEDDAPAGGPVADGGGQDGPRPQVVELKTLTLRAQRL